LLGRQPAVPTDSTCSTRTGTVALVYRGANAPPPVAPVADQVTDQVMVDTTLKAPSFESPLALGWPADDLRYLYEQSVA
jgi:hypothetical protein